MMFAIKYTDGTYYQSKGRGTESEAMKFPDKDLAIIELCSHPAFESSEIVELSEAGGQVCDGPPAEGARALCEFAAAGVKLKNGFDPSIETKYFQRLIIQLREVTYGYIHECHGVIEPKAKLAFALLDEINSALQKRNQGK